MTTIVALKATTLALKEGAKLIGRTYAEHKRRREAEAMETLAGQLAFCTNGASVDAVLSDAEPKSLDLLEEYFFNWMTLLDPRREFTSARLTATYVAQKTARDAFFRRTGELLKNADVVDISELKQLFAIVDSLLHPGPSTGLKPAMEIEITQTSGLVIKLRDEADALASARRPERLFRATRLLYEHRLCSSAVQEEVNHETRISLAFADRLAKLFT